MTYGSERQQRSKLTARHIRQRKGGERLTMLALYDAQMARLAERAGIDTLLVGDSMAMVALGRPDTTSVTLDNIIHHAQAVRAGAPNTHVIGDLPFMTYQVSPEQAIASAGRLVAEGRVDAVKLEGGESMATQIAAIVRAGIPVMAHIGLLPQTATFEDGFRAQGKDEAGARQLLADARAVQDAGAYATVIEMVGAELSAAITSRLEIPTIGIGAGPGCDGQVLVAADMLGMDDTFRPRFVKPYADLTATITGAFGQFADEVRSGTFPSPQYSFKSPAAVMTALDPATADE
ncbi:MAG: 3-methyl-2-oxobutanoate hydroxymethyltransferase [Chloroflexota bacterium]|nr:3-methyl-2-oxobutanoate hydroxymethyltransferase [Chloroflexota bacterium]